MRSLVLALLLMSAPALANPLFTALPAVAEDRVVVVPQGPLAQAIAVQSPLNFDVLLELAKQVAEAAGRARY